MAELLNYRAINLAMSFIYACLFAFYLSHMPILFIGVLSLLCLWNVYLTLTNNPKPNAWLANVLAGLALILMIYTIGIGDTVILFVAMLLLSSIFKLLQAKTKKHYHIIVTLTFFSISSAYLFNQSIITTLTMSALFLLNFAVLSLIESSHSLKLASKQSAKMLFIALPLAIFLLLFLPKMPAFWQLPGPKLAKTGLSEQVDPFDIAKLSNSDELVFRARFDNDTPASPYYWRALVHDTFDGKAWKTSDLLKYNNQSAVPNKQIAVQNTYTIIAEPANQKWLYGLDYAISNNKNVESNALGLLRKKQYQAKSLQYQVSSAALSTEQLSNWQTAYYTHLNNQTNQQAAKLAAKLKQSTTSQSDFYNALLSYFAKQDFSYTLTPEPMSGDSTIDQFLFDKKRGFCGHYASAAAYIFRSAGIPARLASGYLGGEKNQTNNYLSVRQYDAHAWVEVYINNQWQIFDATAVVAPERLNGSLSQNEELNDEFKSNLDFGLVSLSNFAAVNWLRLKLETLDYQWTSWVLGFDEEKQSNFLKSLFGSKHLWLVPLAVILGLAFSFAAYFIYLNWPRNKSKRPPLVSEFEAIKHWAGKNDIAAPSHYSPNQQLIYFAEQSPDAAEPLSEFSYLFNQVRYAKKPFTKERKNQAKDLIKLIKSSK